MITLEILGSAQNPISALNATLGDQAGLNRVMAEAVIDRLERHFEDRAKEGNRRGWPSRGTWLQILDQTGISSVSETDAEISIVHPAIRTKFYGATIIPKERARLAIPATAEAYAAGSPGEGKTPALRVMFMGSTDRNKPLLALVEDTGETKTRPTVWYWLVQSANVPRDPDTLPPTAELIMAAQTALETALQTRGTP